MWTISLAAHQVLWASIRTMFLLVTLINWRETRRLLFDSSRYCRFIRTGWSFTSPTKRSRWIFIVFRSVFPNDRDILCILFFPEFNPVKCIKDSLPLCPNHCVSLFDSESSYSSVLIPMLFLHFYLSASYQSCPVSSPELLERKTKHIFNGVHLVSPISSIFLSDLTKDTCTLHTYACDNWTFRMLVNHSHSLHDDLSKCPSDLRTIIFCIRPSRINLSKTFSLLASVEYR